MRENGTTNMHNENEDNPDHEINTTLIGMLASATMNLPDQIETERRVPDLNIVPTTTDHHHDVVGSHDHSTSTRLFGSYISPNQRSTDDNIVASRNYQNSADNNTRATDTWRFSINGSSPDNSSFRRRFEIGESSRRGAEVGNPRESNIPPCENNNVPLLPLATHPNFVGVNWPTNGNSAAMRFFHEYNYLMSTSRSEIQIGMGTSSSWAPYDLVSGSLPNSNTTNYTHQYMMIWPPGHFVMTSSQRGSNNTSATDMWRFGINGSSPDNSSFRRFEIGESSRVEARVGNSNNTSATDTWRFGINGSSPDSSSFRRFEIGESSRVGARAGNPNNIVSAMGGSSFHPSPFGALAQPNQLPPMFIRNNVPEQNQLLLSLARNDANGNFELILTSTALELRHDRNRLRDQILRAREQLFNSGPGTAEDYLMITEYSMALNMLDAQERLDAEERLDQLEGDAWRYETEGGLQEEEIMTHIMHEVLQSNPEDKENEKCAICQEDLVNGEHIGRLDCDHMFHLECIKEWLLKKNACPICKQTALYIPEEEYESDE